MHLRGNKNIKALFVECRHLRHSPDIGLLSPHSTIHRARAASGCGSTLRGTLGCLLRPGKAGPTSCRTHFFQSTQLSVIRVSTLGKPSLPQDNRKGITTFLGSSSSMGQKPRPVGQVPRQSPPKVPAHTRGQSLGTARNMKNASMKNHIPNSTEQGDIMCLSDMEGLFLGNSAMGEVTLPPMVLGAIPRLRKRR